MKKIKEAGGGQAIIREWMNRVKKIVLPNL